MSDHSFETRKQDHIALSLRADMQTKSHSGLEDVKLIHEALPELDFKEVDLSTSFSFGSQKISTSMPLVISSMTAGHARGEQINRTLAALSHHQRILMGVGSQRKEISDSAARDEWKKIRKESPKALLIGNLGLAQVITSSVDQVKSLVENLEALALYVHLNPLQEVMQPEGTPNFRGGLKAIEKLSKELGVPVIVKETGCGFSENTLKRLNETGIWGVELSGMGGTHWGRIEGARAKSSQDEIRSKASSVFADWGIGIKDSLANAVSAKVNYSLWASGGVRSGLDAAKLIALGASCVGVAQPLLAAAVGSASEASIGIGHRPELNAEDSLARVTQWSEQFAFELKTALFCTGSARPSDLNLQKVVIR